jgi:hypothetical protein
VTKKKNASFHVPHSVDHLRHAGKPDEAREAAIKDELVVRAGQYAIDRQIGAQGFRQVIDALGLYPEFSAMRDKQLKRKEEQEDGEH